MKYITFENAQGQGVGVLTPDESHFLDLTAAGIATDMIALISDYAATQGAIKALLATNADGTPLSDVHVLAPIPTPRRNIFCVGKNYRAHALEFGTSGFDSSSVAGGEIPDMPIIFTKPPSSVIASGDVIPRELDPFDSVDYEGEIAVVVGKDGRVSDSDDPMDFVFGYTIVNDVTSRELQKRHKQWVLGKGIDGFCPMGPVIVPKADAGEIGAMTIKTWVNGELRQSSSIAQLIFDIPRLLRDIGRSISLQAGDLIATGTPEGVGIGFKPPRYLKKGDVVRVEASNVGFLENVVG